MTATQQCGVYPEDSSDAAERLPLESVQVDVVIIGVFAKVILTQTFQNESENPIRAKYIFPVPARAAVCGFEMITENGEIIRGVVEEKDAAAAKHKRAIEEGKVTGLVTWATDDVFTLSLGAIPSQQSITTKLAYAIDLTKDDRDEVRFHLPMYVGERFGTPPHEIRDTLTADVSTRVRVTALIRMAGKIQLVSSSTHPALTLGAYQDGEKTPAHNCAVAEYHSSEFLREDFVMVIKAEGLDKPHCFAERNKEGHIAMQLALVPDIDFPRVPSQEYIFLVDRSGSMEGLRMEKAKQTLIMLLRSLPTEGTTFNIFSFGSTCKQMSLSSMEYNQLNLQSATRHVESMSANLGGTEIQSALQNVFRSRSTNTHTAVIVLTDGETYNIDNTIETVSKAVQQAQPRAPLRVFTLGIGETTSTAMCEGIARAGNGICLMATTSEDILGKCSQLVKASKSSILRNVTINWGVTSDQYHPSAPQPLQAPYLVDSIYPGFRCVVTALFHDRGLFVPEEIVLQGQFDGEESPRRIKVPVQKATVEDGESIPVIHTLAARRFITVLEDPKNPVGPKETRKEMIVCFGTQYQLASRYTSFVAVGKGPPSTGDGTPIPSEAQPNEHPQGGPASFSKLVGDFFGRSFSTPGAEFGDIGAPPTILTNSLSLHHFSDEDSSSALRPIVVSGVGSTTPGFEPRGKVAPARKGVKSVKSGRPPAPASGTEGVGHPHIGTVPSEARVSSQPHTQTSHWQPRPKSPHIIPTTGDVEVSPFSPRGSTRKAVAGIRPPAISRPMLASGSTVTHGIPRKTPIQSAKEPRTTVGTSQLHSANPRDNVFDLVTLQSFDGSFSLSPEFIRILGHSATERGRSLGVHEVIWATALAIAFFRKYLTNQPELLDGLVEKAFEFVARNPIARGLDFERVLQQAQTLV